MIEKLVILCSKVIAQDYCTVRQRYQLQYVCEVALPTSVLSVLFSLLPVNRLLQLEEDYPDSFSWEECWQKLCNKVAEIFERMCMAFPSKSHGSKWSCKEIFLNAYFEELVMSTRMMNRNSHPYPECQVIVLGSSVLQDSIGFCKHDISDEEMLMILLKHITELTINSDNIFDIQDLLMQGSFQKLKYLRLLDKCSNSPDVSADNWIFCINHVLQNSHLQGLCTSNCTQILNHIARVKSSGHGVNSKSPLCGDAAISGSRCTSSKDDDAISIPPAPDSCITVLTLRYCARHASCLDSLKSLQRMYSLERLMVWYYIAEDLLNILNSIRELLESGLSHLKDIHFELFFHFPQRYGLHHHSFLRSYSVGDENISEEKEIKVLSTGIDSLVIAGVCSVATPNLMQQMLPIFLGACNPSYLYMYFDKREYESVLPFFSPSDRTSAKKKAPYRLRKITLVYQTFSNYYYLQSPPSLSELLWKILFFLKDMAKDIDLALHCTVEQLPKNNFTLLFRSVEVTLLETPYGISEILPVYDSEESLPEYDIDNGI